MNAPFHPDRQLIERPQRAVTMLMVGKLRAGERQGLCRIRNVSAGGMMIETRLPLEYGEPVAIEARGREKVTGSVVWQRGERLGIQFDHEVPLDTMPAMVPERPSRVLKAKVPRGPRLQVDCKVEVQLSSGRVEAMLKDISQGGAKLILPLVAQRHARVLLMVPGLPMKLAVVCWTAEETGIAFAEPLGFDLLAEWVLVREGAEALPADAGDC